MARTNRVKAEGDAWYHVMSRTNGRRFLFEGGRVKSALVDALRRAAAFSGVELRACVAMDNHFHAVVRVARPSAPATGEELLRRVGALKGEGARRALAERWGRLASSGAVAAVEAEQGRLRARMHDVSEFVKTFKEEFDRAFKRGRPYCGSVWSGRFASTLVEGGEHLRRCVRYVLYNPVRAGLATRATDYAWSWRAAGADSCAGTGPAQGGPAAGAERPAGRGGCGGWRSSARGRCSGAWRSCCGRRPRWGAASARGAWGRIRLERSATRRTAGASRWPRHEGRRMTAMPRGGRFGWRTFRPCRGGVCPHAAPARLVLVDMFVQAG